MNAGAIEVSRELINDTIEAIDTLQIYRITSADQVDQAFSGADSDSGGRWTSEGTPGVYASLTPSTALLEFLAHLKQDASLSQSSSSIHSTRTSGSWSSAREFLLHWMTDCGQRRILTPRADVLPYGPLRFVRRQLAGLLDPRGESVSSGGSTKASQTI